MPAHDPSFRMKSGLAATVATVVLAALGTAAVTWAEPVAKVGDQEISRSELEARLKPKLIEIENNRYQTLRQGLEELIAEKLMAMEAEARGKTVVDVQNEEIFSKVAEPSEDEIQRVFDTNKAQLKDKTLEDVRPQIVQYLQKRTASTMYQLFVGELKTKYGTKLMLMPPLVEVSPGGRPSRRGDESAPSTMIEFADYECPYFKIAQATVDTVLETSAEKMRNGYRDYPLPFHANARGASQATRCAEEQGKYWEYHDKVFAAKDLTTDGLRSLADTLELDRAKFDECLASGKFDAAIDEDVSEGSEAGVSGTPAFFINGRFLSGALPFDQLKAVIDDELERLGG